MRVDFSFYQKLSSFSFNSKKLLNSIDQKIVKIAALILVCIVGVSLLSFYLLNKRKGSQHSSDERLNLESLNIQKKEKDFSPSGLSQKDNHSEKASQSLSSSTNSQKIPSLAKKIQEDKEEENQECLCREFMIPIVGGKEVYEALPELDLSKLERWIGDNGSPDSFKFEDVTAPIMRGVNGLPGYEYLIIKFKVDFQEGMHIFFWKTQNDCAILDGCMIRGGYEHLDSDMRLEAQSTGTRQWNVLQDLIAQKELEILGKKYTLGC